MLSRTTLSSLLVIFFLVAFFVLSAVPSFASASIIGGPTLNMAEQGWQDFGLVIRADSDTTLVSVRYPNQGLADVIQLWRNSDSALLASIPVPNGDVNATININCPLSTGQVYTLVATTPNNRYFGFPAEFAFPAGDTDITVLGSYYTDIAADYGNFYYGLWFSFNDITTEPETQKLAATIDIKPGSDVNSINLGSKGVVPVAILTTGDLDALDVAPQTVTFAGASPVKWHIEDVDGDGYDDILFQFKTQDLTGLSSDSAEADLEGATLEGIPFSGTDTVRIVPGK